MAKIRFEGEWKMWIGVAVLIGCVVGYLYLVSRPPMEGGEYLWNVTKILDSRTVSLKGSGSTIQFRLIGVRIPESQDKACQDYLQKSLNDQWLRIKTVREDSKGVREGFIYLSGEDVTARLVRQGLARIDLDEKAFDVRPYIELEQEAERQKRGLWAQSGQGAK